MSVIAIVILVILMIAALLIVLLVLLQDEGGEGLGGIFGGGGAQQLGARGGNPLTRITSILGVIFILSSLSLGWLIRSSDIDNVERAAEELRASGTEDEVLEWWESLETDNDQDDAIDESFLDEVLQRGENTQ